MSTFYHAESFHFWNKGGSFILLSLAPCWTCKCSADEWTTTSACDESTATALFTKTFWGFWPQSHHHAMPNTQSGAYSSILNKILIKYDKASWRTQELATYMATTMDEE